MKQARKKSPIKQSHGEPARKAKGQPLRKTNDTGEASRQSLSQHRTRFNAPDQREKRETAGERQGPRRAPSKKHVGQQPVAGTPLDTSPSRDERIVEEKIISLHKQGMPPDQIAKKIARQRHKVVYTLQKAGLYPTPNAAALG